MWFVGLIVGAVLGSMAGLQGTLFGALCGALLGHLAVSLRRGAGDARLAAAEENVARLLLRLESIEQRLERVEGSARHTSGEQAASAQPPAPQTTGEAEPVAAAATSAPGERVTSEPAVPPLVAPEPSTPAPPSPQAVSALSPAVVPTMNEAHAASAGAAPALPPSAFWSWLTGGNPFVRIGVVVLFFGVAFLLRYAVEHVAFPIETRLASVALGGLVLLAIGWRLRVGRTGYALILQGAGLGVLFITVFASYRLYGLLPPLLTFALLLALAGASAFAAIAQDSRALAVAGVTGGFLAPVLASTGVGSHVALFSYYLVLDAAILAIAWFKPWRVLNIVGFAFTFVVGALWGARFYRPELYASTQPFLIAFFLFYVTIAVLFARRQALQPRAAVDGTLVFGTPLIAFLLQTRLVDDTEFGAAYSAGLLSLFYLGLAAVLCRRAQPGLRLLMEAFLALGIVFATAAIPLAFDARVSAASWALEGAAIVWVSVRQRRTAGQVFGTLLQFAAGTAFVLGGWPGDAALPVLNSATLGAAMVALGGLYCSWLLDREAADRRDWRDGASAVLMCWGLAFLCMAGLLDVDRFLAGAVRPHALLIFLLLTCLVFAGLQRRLDWPRARLVAYAWLPVMVLFALADAVDNRHPFAHLGYVAWPLGACVHFVLLRRYDREARPLHAYHAAGLCLLTALTAWEVSWAIGEMVHGGSVWRAIGWVIVPAAVLWLLGMRDSQLRWPVAQHLAAYLRTGAAPIALFVFAWTVTVNFLSSGNPAPLPYVPLLNPLDLAQICAFLGVGVWIRALRRNALDTGRLLQPPVLVPIALGAAFIWLTAVLLRTLHHWAAIPFDWDELVGSMLVQASVSIFWTLLALFSMIVANRRGLRALWLGGALLLGVVTLKLFFVDLSDADGIARIVSFLGVGVLLLVVGYFSPAPPKQVP